jgi:hypothetical protein
MTPSFRDIAEELARLAGEHGWTATTDFVRALLDPTRRRTVAVLRLLDADVTGLVTWGAGVCPGDIAIDVASSADATWLVDRVLVAFPCGGLPTTDALEALAAGAFARPAETVAIVLTGADQIASVEDLALVEATARRWLLPRSKAEGLGGELAAEGAYLRADVPVADPGLVARLARDADALARWLREPISPEVGARLDRDRLAFALEMALSEIRSPSDDQDGRARRWTFEVGHDLAALRERVLGRLRSEADALETAVAVAIDGLEADLSAGMRAFLDRRSIPVHDSGPAIVELVARFCQDTIQRWGTEPREADRQWQGAVGELGWLVREFDWSPVNRAVHDPDGYPARLLRHLSRGGGLGEPLAPSGPRRVLQGPEFLDGAGMAKVAGAAVLGPAAAGLAGFGPISMALAGAASISAVMAQHWQATRTAALGTAEECGRRMIAETVAEFRVRFSGEVTALTGGLRSALAVEFDAAQDALDAALRSSGPASSGPPAPDALAGLRIRLAAIPSHPEPGTEPPPVFTQVDP